MILKNACWLVDQQQPQSRLELYEIIGKQHAKNKEPFYVQLIIDSKVNGKVKDKEEVSGEDKVKEEVQPHLLGQLIHASSKYVRSIIDSKVSGKDKDVSESKDKEELHSHLLGHLMRESFEEGKFEEAFSYFEDFCSVTNTSEQWKLLTDILSDSTQNDSTKKIVHVFLQEKSSLFLQQLQEDPSLEDDIVGSSAPFFIRRKTWNKRQN